MGCRRSVVSSGGLLRFPPPENWFHHHHFTAWIWPWPLLRRTNPNKPKSNLNQTDGWVAEPGLNNNEVTIRPAAGRILTKPRMMMFLVCFMRRLIRVICLEEAIRPAAGWIGGSRSAIRPAAGRIGGSRSAIRPAAGRTREAVMLFGPQLGE